MFIPIRSYDNYINANINLGMLEEAGINCHIKDEYTITIDPLLSPALGGMKLMVEETQVHQAIRLLDEAEKSYLQTIPCPSCHENRLELINQTTNHISWTDKLKSLLLNGQEQEVKIFYRCGHCLTEFKELPH